MRDNQPKEYDAVLGRQLQAPIDSAVLGEIKGVKKRFDLEPIEQKLVALKDALKYGDAGLDLIIEALQHQLPQIKQLAYTLLCHYPDLKAKQVIEKCNQYQFFQCLDIIESGHKRSVVWVRFTSDGKKLISASKDMTIKVWDLDTGRVIRNLATDISKCRGITNYINIALSLDEKIICCVTNNNSNIEVWNLETLSKIYTLEGHSDGKNQLSGALAISLDGKTLFSSSSDKYIKVWNLQKGNLLRSFEWESDFVCLCLSPDEKILFSGTYNEVVLWDWKTGTIIKTFKLNSKYYSYFNWVYDLTVSLDGRLLIAKSLKTIKIWDLETEQEIHSFNNEENTFKAIDLSQDGETLVISAWKQPIEVWDLKTGQLINRLELHVDIIALALSPDRKTLVIGSEDRIIRLWDLQQKEQICTLSGLGSVYSTLR